MDFQFELGKTLDSTLRLFAKENLCAENIVSSRAVTREVAKETLFALYNRGYQRRAVKAPCFSYGDETAQKYRL